MSEPFLSEIRIFGFNFAPRSWAQCDGQILPINQNQSLYSLLGTTYGGDGRTSFGLPELRGRVPIETGNGHNLGSRSGSPTVGLTSAQIPSHAHQATASNANASTGDPAGQLLAVSTLPNVNPYATAGAAPDAVMDARMVANGGSNQGHENMQPYLALNFCIALQGLFPSRN